MGWGDEIMASGAARQLSARQGGRPVAILDRNGRPRAHDAWRNLRFVDPRSALALQHGGHCRPYIAEVRPDRFVWRPEPTPPVPGALAFDRDEERFAATAPVDALAMVVIEPSIKDRASPNKQWPRERWQALVDAMPAVNWVQLGPAGTAWLDHVERLITPTFRHAAAVLARAKAAVLPEGGLHHAAAALGIPAVVIFGGYVSPAVTGYAAHRNIFTGSGLGCGCRHACLHGQAAMAAIGVDRVRHELEAIL